MTDETQPGDPAPAEQTPSATASIPVDTGATTTPHAADAGAETTDENAEGEQPKKRNRGGFQDRIKELTDKVKERDQRIAELAAAKATGDATDGAAPKRESYANYEDFIEAKAAYAAEQTYARKERETAEHRATQARDERLTAFGAEMNTDAAADPAFKKAWETVARDEKFPVSEAMFDFVSESDDPHALIEWLADNRAEAAKLYNASPAQVARALARVEANTATAPPARTPQAPPPPPTVGGRSAPRVNMDKIAASEDASEYIRLRRQQMAGA